MCVKGMKLRTGEADFWDTQRNELKDVLLVRGGGPLEYKKP